MYKSIRRTWITFIKPGWPAGPPKTKTQPLNKAGFKKNQLVADKNIVVLIDLCRL